MPSLFPEGPLTGQLGSKGSIGVMVNRDGLKLATYYWPATCPGPAKGVVLGVHGHGAYLFIEYLAAKGPGTPVQYRDSWIEKMNSSGYSVCGIDLQSCGFSQGKYDLRCYIDSFDDHVQDVIQFARSLHDTSVPGFQKLPMFIMGCSLGGCITVNVMRQAGNLFKGAILLAPMLSLERVSQQGLNPYLRPIASLISLLFPAWPIVVTDKNTMYPELQQEWDEDPLCWHGKTRARVAAEYLRITEDVCANMKSFTFPYLAFHSENDTMCDCDGSKKLYAESQAKDKTLRHVNQMWHVIVKEDGNDKVLQEIVEWINKRV
ncbi:hypothetical protein WJX72_006113 [[Myrmecia] bisecta]|uniref:Serine aminopeptidase S33 domain-containing protein n=1 Tax=[Myrmecia] bisecta TaxID=41462 RepID=A0AAW1QFH4_9CHLO